MSVPDTPAFDAPWQAQSFALVVASVDAGLFTWPDWTEVFSRYRGLADAAEDASDYYQDWLQALEEVLAARGAASPVAIEATAAAWVRASHATPHGMPITLANDPQGG